jgi:hypothetical protein
MEQVDLYSIQESTPWHRRMERRFTKEAPMDAGPEGLRGLWRLREGPTPEEWPGAHMK